MLYLEGALIGHLVGDYLLQNDWMALNKKQSSFHCAIHCGIWALAVSAFGEYFDPITFSVLFATHFIQDRTGVVLWYMKLIGQEKFATGICAPWSVIVVDNVWHIVTIYALWRFTLWRLYW